MTCKTNHTYVHYLEIVLTPSLPHLLHLVLYLLLFPLIYVFFVSVIHTSCIALIVEPKWKHHLNSVLHVAIS